MSQRIEEFRQYRERMNDRILSTGNLGFKRFFNLDAAAYRPGVLSEDTKELLGLTASMVLRCNDCIDYHLGRAIELGVSNEAIEEALQVSLIVGGSIVIPHLRHAFETIDALRAEAAAKNDNA